MVIGTFAHRRCAVVVGRKSEMWNEKSRPLDGLLNVSFLKSDCRGFTSDLTSFSAPSLR